jgi:hypothetical protein
MGFSADWLALREPADHAARDGALLDAAARVAGARPVVVDLGCGTGSTRRAFGARLEGAAWRMVDGDAGLLRLAGGEGHCLDLNDVEALPLEGATLVAASALFDLVSAAWMDRLVARVAGQGLPLYAALNYDGVMDWTPELPEDGQIRAAFNRHQVGDKGFGPALGLGATGYLAERLRAAGYAVREGDSPWRLGPAEVALQGELLAGIAQAAQEAGFAGDAQAWRAARMAQLGQGQCRIGHRDLLAVPQTVSERRG